MLYLSKRYYMQNMHLAKSCLKCHLPHKAVVGWELCSAFTGTMFLLGPRRCRGVGYQQITTQCLWGAALLGRSQVIPLCDKGGVPVAVGRAVSETKRINTKRSRGEGRGL